MKNQFLLLLGFSVFMFVSCEKDDDHHDECQECHIALMEEDGTEHPWEIEGEFCGDALVDIEANGWIATEDIIGHDDEVEYAEGEVVPADMIHCEEHADHDHDDHDH